jgi:ABC-2 type transport system permease protein
VNEEVSHRFNERVTWFGWPVPPAVEVLMVIPMGVVLLGVAIVRFRRTD